MNQSSMHYAGMRIASLQRQAEAATEVLVQSDTLLALIAIARAAKDVWGLMEIVEPNDPRTDALFAALLALEKP